MVTSRSSMVLLCAAPVCAAVGSWGSSASASIPVTPALAVCGSWDWASARASWTPDTQIEVTAVWVHYISRQVWEKFKGFRALPIV